MPIDKTAGPIFLTGAEPIAEKTLGSMLFYSPTRLEFGRLRSNELVVVIHGWLSGAMHTETLARELREKLGYTTYRLDLSLTFGSVEGFMKECEKQLSAINFGRDFKRVHIVAHSMGGLVSKMVLSEWEFPNFGKMVALGSPFRGSKVLKAAGEVSRLVAYTFFYQKYDEIIKAARAPLPINKQAKIGAIAGDKPYTIEQVLTRADYELRTKLLGKRPNDGSVTVDSAFGLGPDSLSDTAVVHKNHMELLMEPPTALIGRFLQTGKFK